MSTNQKKMTLAEAIALSISASADDREVRRFSESSMWKWYRIGYAIHDGAFTRAKFIKESESDESTVTQAIKVAECADRSVKFRRAFEGGEFASLRAAYDARKKFGAVAGKGGRPASSTPKQQSVVVKPTATKAQIRAAIKKLEAMLAAK